MDKSSYPSESLSEALHQTKARKRFLIIEDDQDIARLVGMHLKDMDAEVTTVNDGRDGLNHALNNHWDAILLDLQLPGIDGLDICRAIRSKTDFVPVMMLTSRSTELDRVLGLEIGADDYMVKPFSIPELKARVKALLRRVQAAQVDHSTNNEQLNAGALQLNQSTRQVTLNGAPIELTAKEFDLLWFFASQPEQVFKRSELLDKVWGYGHEGYEHTVNSHINRLRAKIETNAQQPKYIQTVWGVGYRFATLV